MPYDNKMQSFQKQLDNLAFDKGLDWDSAEVKAIRKKRDEYVKAFLVKKYGENFGMEMYQRLAGEIEARDTSARSKLTTKQRREQFPYESQGIPEDQWIVRDGNGTSFSIEKSKTVIPNFKSSEGATAFGIELKRLYKESLSKGKEIKSSDFNAKMREATRGQFYREAFEAAEKKGSNIQETLKDKKISEKENKSMGVQFSKRKADTLTTKALKYNTAKEFVDAQSEYVRYSQDPSGQAKDSKAGYQMFVEKGDEDSAKHYGKYQLITDGEGAINSETLEIDIAEAFKNNPEILQEYQTTAEELAADASPEDIIDSAGLWDNPDLVQVIWEEVLKPKGIFKVKTPNGMIVFDPSLIKTKAQLTDIWNKAQEERKTYQTDIQYGKVHRDDSIPQIREANPEALEELRKNIYGWLKDVLPKSVLKRISVSLTSHISLKGKNARISQEQWAEILEQPGEIMGTATTDVLHSFIELCYNFDNDTIQKVTYHEAFHVAAKWLLPDADYKQIIDYFNGNEEVAANAFMNFAKRMKEDKVRQPFIKRIFRKLRLIFKRIRNGLKGKGFKTPEDVFVKLWGKSMIYYRLGKGLKGYGEGR